MNLPGPAQDDRGFALLAVVVISFAVAALAIGAIFVTGNARLIGTYDLLQSEMEAAADAGLEEGRMRLNAEPDLYPLQGYTTIEEDEPVQGVNGEPVPGLTRTTWVGPTGVTTGQYGVFGSVITEVKAPNGTRVVRRGEMAQESFARYGYFTNSEGRSPTIVFGLGDRIEGPAHSNDRIVIHNTGATFTGNFTTARHIDGKEHGTFEAGYEEDAMRIEMPSVQNLDRLRSLAQPAGYAFNSGTGGTVGTARMRIEFLEIDGRGYFKVYRAPNNRRGRNFVVARHDTESPFLSSRNCGRYCPPGSRVHPGNDRRCVECPQGQRANPLAPTTCVPQSALLPLDLGQFRAATDYSDPLDQRRVLINPDRACFLGGADELWGEFDDDDDEDGEWLEWDGNLPSSLEDRLEDDLFREDVDYLFPLDRALNPDFLGVIHVNGNVAVSGTVRGRITLAVDGNIVIADDLVYATDPGAQTCEDITGLFAGGDIVVANNAINVAQSPSGNPPWRNMNLGRVDEQIHAVILTLQSFRAEDHAGGATGGEPCGDNEAGRGCLAVTGGIIQGTRAPVGALRGSVDDPDPPFGYIKRYSYDQCAFTDPPPYFPTTGIFDRGRVFEIDPNRFDVEAEFARLTPSSD